MRGGGPTWNAPRGQKRRRTEIELTEYRAFFMYVKWPVGLEDDSNVNSYNEKET